jgi:hypothetical protein
MLQQLNVDPTLTQKRLGDGFYEQKLIREQVASSLAAASSTATALMKRNIAPCWTPA